MVGRPRHQQVRGGRAPHGGSGQERRARPPRRRRSTRVPAGTGHRGDRGRRAGCWAACSTGRPAPAARRRRRPPIRNSRDRGRRRVRPARRRPPRRRRTRSVSGVGVDVLDGTGRRAGCAVTAIPARASVMQAREPPEPSTSIVHSWQIPIPHQTSAARPGARGLPEGAKPVGDHGRGDRISLADGYPLPVHLHGAGGLGGGEPGCDHPGSRVLAGLMICSVRRAHYRTPYEHSPHRSRLPPAVRRVATTHHGPRRPRAMLAGSHARGGCRQSTPNNAFPLRHSTSRIQSSPSSRRASAASWWAYA